ncbi:MAG: sulfur carrier protein ThiS [Ahniella sp.]|nr:sulfur carrier protein ThiS [Ahniella sp.]
MRIEVNGHTREFADGTSLAEVLQAEGLAGRRVAIEVNLELVPRSQHAALALKHGDRVEIVQAMGGG